MSHGGVGAVIVAGGAGTRLAGVLAGRPKALASFAGHTLLDHQLERVGFLKPVVVLAYHQAETLLQHVGERAEVLVEPRPLGTAGGLALLPPGPDAWLCINVDHVSDVDLRALVAGWRPPCTAVLSTARVHVDEGVVELVESRVTRWRERPTLELPVTTGLYVFAADAIRQHVSGRLDMPELIRRLIPEGVHAWRHPGWWIDAGTPSRLAEAERRWAANSTG